MKCGFQCSCFDRCELQHINHNHRYTEEEVEEFCLKAYRDILQTPMRKIGDKYFICAPCERYPYFKEALVKQLVYHKSSEADSMYEYVDRIMNRFIFSWASAIALNEELGLIVTDVVGTKHDEDYIEIDISCDDENHKFALLFKAPDGTLLMRAFWGKQTYRLGKDETTVTFPKVNIQFTKKEYQNETKGDSV